MSVMMENRHDVPFQRGRDYEEQPAGVGGYAHDPDGAYLNQAASMMYDQTHANGMMFAQPIASNNTTYLSPQSWSSPTPSEHISPKAYSDHGISDMAHHNSPNNLEQFPEMHFLALPDTTDMVTGDLGYVNSVQHLPGPVDNATLSYLDAQIGNTGQLATPQHLSPDMTGGLNMVPDLSTSYYQQSPHVSLAENNTLAAPLDTGLVSQLDLSLDTNSYTMPPHMRSPIVRVVRSDSPQGVPMSPTHSKRGHGSRKSSVHLSPYNDPSDDEDELDDIAEGSQNRLGLAPQSRDQIKDLYVPSIEEMEQKRLQYEKNNEVEDWLTRSEFSSNADEEDIRERPIGRRNNKGRRRAKSTNDAPPRNGYGANSNLTVAMPRYDDSRIPGPGIYIDERSEVDEAEDDDEPDSPAADLNIQARDSDESYFPPMSTEDAEAAKEVKTQPWADTPSEAQEAKGRYQPLTSNAAMMRFKQRAKDIESASLTATIGSRRNWSDTDLSSLFSATGISAPAQPSGRDVKPKEKDGRPRRGSFFDNFMSRRATNSNILKRKTGHPNPPPKSPVRSSAETVVRKETEVSLAPPKRIGSWGRAKSPKPEAGVSRSNSDLKPNTPTIITPPTGPFSQVKNVIRRSRSRTDLGRSTPGLAELMTQFGGPPVVSINSPQPEAPEPISKTAPEPRPGANQAGAADGDSVFMDLAVRSDPIIPTLEGFKDQVRQLNPRIPEYLLDRLTQEQHKRYKRLLQMKIDHLKSVKNGKCSSGKFCFALGGKAELLPPRPGAKDSDGPLVGFQILQPGMSEDDMEASNEGGMIPASFPSGIPLPPVPSLPAQFECPLCFKVKKFMKPSDWTKHVREDTQPFTCTFPNCTEPRSFSRKADWVRHESERHRQLESWTCNIKGCIHTCFRRDNFVQHLDREHKMPVVRVRLGRGQGSKSPNTPLDPTQPWDQDMSADVSAIIEQCHHKTTKDPKQEPCKFCHNILSDWKKLEVHLSKHMEQISLPALRLVEQRKVDADTKLSPVEAPPKAQLAVSPSSMLGANSPYFSEPGTYDDEPISARLTPRTNFPSFDSSMAALSVPVSSSVANTYPPPQIPSRRPSATQLASPMYGYPNTPDVTNIAYHHTPAVTPPNMHTNVQNGNLSVEDHRNSRYMPGMGNTYPPLLTIPSNDFGQQQGYHDPSSAMSSAISPYNTTELAPTYLQQGGFSGSPTGSMYDQNGVPRPSTGHQNDPFAVYGQQQQYYGGS